MIRTLIWKEWREHRAKYVFYWLTLNAPILLVAMAVGVSTNMRTPFSGLSDGTILQYLPIALGEPFFVTTVCLLATAYLAVATFMPEIEDRTLLFVYEQPVSRRRYVATKLLIGGAHVALAVSFAVLFAALLAYLMMLASGKVSAAGSAAAFRAVMAAAGRAVVWSSLISLIVFAGSALASAVSPRWWMAAAGAVVLIVLLAAFGSDFFNYMEGVGDADPISFSFSFGTGNWHWVTLSRPLHLSEVAAFARWRALPLLVAALLTAAFSAVAAQVYARKEIR